MLREFKIEDPDFNPVDIFNFLEQKLIKESNHSGFILVYHGRNINRFVHAAAVIRYEINFRPYMLLLDSKNSEPLYHPLPPHKDFHPIEVDKDIQDEDIYFKWEVFEVTTRNVDFGEARVLQNKMMHMLTGEERYL